MVRQSVIHNHQALKPAGLTLTTIVAAFFERLENYNVERIYDYVDFVHSKLTCLYSDNRDFFVLFKFFPMTTVAHGTRKLATMPLYDQDQKKPALIWR